MISKTQKWVFGSALAINIVALGAIGTVLHQRYVDNHTINLGTITVTAPAVISKPRLAANHSQVIDLGVITVAPTSAQLLEVARLRSAEQPVADLSAMEPLMQALDMLTPGQFLNDSAVMDVLGTLAFEHADR